MLHQLTAHRDQQEEDPVLAIIADTEADIVVEIHTEEAEGDKYPT